MPWICPSQVRGVLSSSFLRMLSHCARSESNLLLTHQSSRRRNLMWSTCSVDCFHILPYTSILLPYTFVLLTELLVGVNMSCRYQIGSLSCGDSALIIGVIVCLMLFMGVVAIIVSAGMLLHVIRRFWPGRASTAGARASAGVLPHLIRRCLPGRAAGSEGNDDARDFDRSEFWMLDGYPACLPPSYSEAMRDYPIFDGILADNVGQMSTMV